MPSDHVGVFFEAAPARSIGRPAAVLHTSQPAATKTIQEREALLGVALFDRSRRRLTPTSV